MAVLQCMAVLPYMARLPYMSILQCMAVLRQKACVRDALRDLRRTEHVLEMCPRSKLACARDVLGFCADEGTCACKGFMLMCRGHH